MHANGWGKNAVPKESERVSEDLSPSQEESRSGPGSSVSIGSDSEEGYNPSPEEMVKLVRRKWTEDDGTFKLDLSLCLQKYTDEELSRLMAVIVAEKPHVQQLRLDGNSIGEVGATKIAEALPSLSQLTELYLDGNSIGEVGATKIAEALPSLSQLTVLYLGSNSIGEVGATKIAEALPSLSQLTELWLNSNSIGEVGATKIAEALPSLSQLTRLYLNGNSIGEVGATKIAEALPSLSQLTRLDLDDNSIGEVGATKIAEALPSLVHLTELYLDVDPNKVEWRKAGWAIPAEVLAAAQDINCHGVWDWGPMAALMVAMAGETTEWLPAHVRARLKAGGKEEPAGAHELAGLSLAEELAGAAGPGVAEQPLQGGAVGGAWSGWTLESSNFKAAYAQAEEAREDYTLLAAIDQFLTAYFQANGWPVQEAKLFITKLRKEGHKSSDDFFMEGLSDVGGYAQRMWSSTTLGHGREFCSMVNEAIRGDERGLMEPVALFARTMNAGLITRRALHGVAWPPKNETYRGGILPARYLGFYIGRTGQKYRVPGFLASSFDEDVADEFAQRAWQSADGKEPAVRYVIRVDPEGKTRKVRRCQHVSLIRKSNRPEEQEFLYVPFSTFTVLEVQTSPTPNYLTPHVVLLQSSIDNMIEPEDLPLAPWY